MKKHHFITLSFIALIGASFILPSKNIDGEKEFNVSIYQNGKTLVSKNNVILLEDTTFNIVLNFSEPMGVLVSASYDKKTFKNAKRNKSLDKLPGFIETGMAEAPSNPDKEILIHDNAPSYWYYESDSMNRFNETKQTGQGIRCIRTVENLFEIPTRTKLELSDVKNDLYLVFISYKTGDKITERVEIQRHYLKLKWKS